MLRSCLVLLLVAAPPAARAQWQADTPLSVPRTAAAWAVLDGRLYVVGGQSAGGEVLRSGEAFTPGAGWAPIADLQDPRAGARLVALDGKLYLVGGHDGEGPEDDLSVYDPAADRWDSDRSMQRERDGLAAGAIDGTLYALGGADDDGVLLADAERFDGEDWLPEPAWSLTPARAGSGSASVTGAVVVAGGFSTLGPLAQVERFAPGGGASLAEFPSGRGAAALAAAGDTLFAVGGRDAGDERLPDVLRLDPAASAWTDLPSLPEPREDAVAAVLGGDLYVAGGTGAFGSVLATVVRLSAVVVTDEPVAAGTGLTLRHSGPNPARGLVALWAATERPETARVAVYDVRGREVAVLHDGPLGPSGRPLRWAASGFPAGVYLARLTTPSGRRALRVATVR